MNQLGLPTADELRRLEEAFRRDPRGAFVSLGNAYLALSRPRDAIEVAAQVIDQADSVDGRMVLGRAFYQLHQWKEAQAQLLRVVKADRNHGEGFCLLGEVLMRRGDFERALPVLQHAHNLDPANPAVLVMVKRARGQQALDEPRPIPSPREAAGSGGPVLPATGSAFDDEPTNLAPPALIGASGPTAAQRPVAQHVPSSRAPSSNPAEGVRPRVYAPDKRRDAAKESLRASAAVGEDYLNQLLTAGLLDLPNVRVAAGDYSVDGSQKWGRSAGRTFLVLFVLLFLGVGSGGGWYYYAEKQKAETIAQYLARAKAEAQAGSYDGLKKAADEAKSALDLDKREPYSIAVLSHIMGLSSYLYGDVKPAEVELGIATAEATIDGPTKDGYRELVLARAASSLAQLSELESADQRLAEIRQMLRAHLAENPDDHLARWLSGRAMLAAGDRKGAMAAFEQAAARGQGTILAAIDRADMMLDDGEYEKAMAAYDEILKKSPDHPLACIGRSLARSERSIESAEAMADLNVCLGPELGPRVGAYKQEALAFAFYAIEDYEDFGKSLGSATGVAEPRFLARLALARLLEGNITDAGTVRASIKWFANDPQPHPLVVMSDAELYYATGSNDEVMSLVEKRTGLRPSKLRAKVYWDQSKFEEAADELKAALAIAPEDMEARAYMLAIQMLTSRGSEHDAAEAELDRLCRRAKNKLPRHVYGEALLRDGRFERAREEFEKALAEVGEDAPHPVAFRSHVALAELDANAMNAAAAKNPEEAAARLKTALEHLNAALKQNPSNLPALDLAGRLLKSRDPEQALQFLIGVVDSGEATGAAELAYAELLAPSKNDVDRTKAREAVLRAKSKGVGREELARVAELVGGASLAKEALAP